MKRNCALTLTCLAGLALSPICPGQTKVPTRESTESLRAGAEKGDVAAQFNLALAYSQGHGVPQDYAEAVRWYRKAAEAGYPEAQHRLGIAYNLGRGVPQDYMLAYVWLNLGAATSYSDERERFAALRDKVAQKLTPQQLGEAQRLSREWKPTVGNTVKAH